MICLLINSTSTKSLSTRQTAPRTPTTPRVPKVNLGSPLPAHFLVVLLFERLLLLGVFDDDEFLLVGVVAVFLVIRQHRQHDAVGLALLDDHVHELLIRLGLLAV